MFLDFLFKRRPASDEIVFDNDFLRKLDVMQLASARASGSLIEGQRSGYARGGQLEFRDYRDYTPGDDIRFIDWNVYARLEKAYVKTFARRHDARVTILLDSSASMSFGSPAKLLRAQRLCAAIGHIGLFGGDTVDIWKLGDTPSMLGSFRSRTASAAMLSALSGITASGSTGTSGITAVAASHPLKGALIVVSDAWWHDGWQAELGALSMRVGPTALIQIFSETDTTPPSSGRYRFTDSESGAELPLACGEDFRERYTATIRARLDTIRAFCLSANIHYSLWTPELSLNDILMSHLRATGFLI